MIKRRSHALILDPTDIVQLLQKNGIEITNEDDVTLAFAQEDGQEIAESCLREVCLVVKVMAEIGSFLGTTLDRDILPMTQSRR